MKYGLGVCSAPLEELENGLGTTYFYLTSRLGVVRSIPKQLRYLPHQYCGMGLLNLPIETTAAQVNCLLQHYGTDSALGHTMMAALEHMQLEIGVEGCPLGYSFQKYGCLVTNTWAKSLWGKIQAFKIDVTLHRLQRPEPPEGATGQVSHGGLDRGPRPERGRPEAGQ